MPVIDIFYAISTPKHWLVTFIAPIFLPLTVNEFTDHVCLQTKTKSWQILT